MTKVDSITVRMYNTGSVGDCLLLLFKKNNVTTFSMLIDCGGYHTDAAIITDCAKDIKITLDNKPLDLVVVTHEHLDHVSGFNQAKSIFDSIDFNQVWMAWTENPGDPIAQQLKKKLGKKLKALISALNENHKRLKSKMSRRSNSFSVKKRLQKRFDNWTEIIDALNFENGTFGLNAKRVGLTNSNAIVYVKSKSKQKSKEKMFKKPGDVISDMKGVEGIRFHILGPPYDQDLSGIRNKTQEDEMYSFQKRVAFSRSQAFLNAVSSNGSNPKFSKSPFSEKYKLDQADEKDFNKFYNSNNISWRQIEEDWLEVSEELAIAVNTYTNNTSLAMAIEFESSGKVLLFPADAQSGNWISWHNQEVKQKLIKNGGKTAEELLQRTIFYKVGHHGSHNGTASKSGLNNMNSPGLVAMMPLVQDKVPSRWGGSKNFPAKALYSELIKKTNGAIIRTDEGLIKDKRAKELRDKNISREIIKKLAKVSDNKLYQEWTIEN